MSFDSITHITSEVQLEDALATPSSLVVDAVKQIDGDIMILGASGKMGPSLARLIKRAIVESGSKKNVFAVSRFTNGTVKKYLDESGIKTIECDLLKQDQLDALPEVPNIIYMVGRKFGSVGNEALTWMMNTFLLGMIIKKFRNSRIVFLSTGNVYPFVPINSGGSKENDTLHPIGEYAQSCLGRERIIEYWCNELGVGVVIIRLNYAIDLRYGVLLDIAQKVKNQIPIDLEMGYVNVIWQGDANSGILLSLNACDNPPLIMNMTGKECISIRWLAEQFGKSFHIEPVFINREAETALLSNANLFHRTFDFPKVTIEQMINWSVHWILIDGATLNKPTHFQERNGKF